MVACNAVLVLYGVNLSCNTITPSFSSIGVPSNFNNSDTFNLTLPEAGDCNVDVPPTLPILTKSVFVLFQLISKSTLVPT